MLIRKKFAVMLSAAAAAGILGSGMTACAENMIRPGIRIEEIDLSGMTQEEAEAAVLAKVSAMQNSSFRVMIGEESVSATAVDFGIQWKNRSVVEDAMRIGNSGNAVARYKDNKDLAQGEKNLDLEFSVNEETVRKFVTEKCLPYEQDPVEASIESDGSGGIDLQVGEDGVKINVDESVAMLSEYLTQTWDGSGEPELSVVAEIAHPKADEEDLESIRDILGTYTTYYGSTYGRNTNVERGAELINGHLILPGESFSVCDHLVPFSAENGYELGGAYENGRVVQEYGGGICQVSTTLYNALLLAEVEIVERHNHTMSVSYVPTSMDAAIAEGSMDLVFYNDRSTPIFISGYAYGGELTFTVWGKETRPKDRTVEYYSETVSSIPAPSVSYLYPNGAQPMGYFSQVQFAMEGSSAVLYKYVTQNGETTVEQVNSSTYEATPNSFEVGTMGASDAYLQAVYSNDLASAQLAATGQLPQTTQQVNPDGTVVTPGTTVQTENTAGGIVEVYTDPTSGIVTDPNAGYTDPNAGYTDSSLGYTDPNAGYTDLNTGYTDPNAGGSYVDTQDGEVWVADNTISWE